ncbi:pentapeptide repeat-containing protein [Corynebacterium sp. CCM 9185]|nr:pentapeptide repeat-containing protein [Corynebacterium marambiense]
MEGAYLGEARLEGAKLRGARLEGAYLGGARLEGTDLRGVHLEGANLRFARLEGAKLADGDDDWFLLGPCTFDENTQWQDATYSPSTVFPEGFDPKTRGMKLVDDPEPEETPEDND